MSETENKKPVASDDAGDKADDRKVVPKKEKVPLTVKLAKMFREYKSELKKIVWYSREQTLKSSIIVIVSIAAVGVCIAGLDFLFSNLLMWLGKLV